jgi:adenylate cyclase
MMGAVVVYLFVPPSQRPAFIERLEYLAYDQRMQLSVSSDTIDSQIVVVDIDQPSQDSRGQWPWPRNLTANLIANLLEHYQVSGVGLDVYFPDEASCAREADSVLGDVLQQYSSNIVMALKVTNQSQPARKNRSDVTGNGVLLQGNSSLSPTARYWGNGIYYSGNLARFVTPQTAIGHIIPVVDPEDDKVRRLLPVYRFGKQYFDTLSLSMWRQMLGADSLLLDTSLDNWLDSPKLRLMVGGEVIPGYAIPINHRGEVLIPYHANVDTVSAVDVMDKRLSPDSLVGKFVLIGSSAQAQGDDLVSTPLRSQLPGVEIHAVMLGAMLASAQAGEVPRFKVQPAHEITLQVVLMLFSLLSLLLARRFGVRAMLLTGPLLLVSWAAGNYWLWAAQNVALEFLPLAAFTLMLLLYLGISDLLEINVRHRHVRRMFGYYLPEAVVHRLATDWQGTDWLKPERREMTILFADVQGFTTMAETLPPEVVADITKQLFTGLTGVIHQHQGTVDKYMGDAVMAFWGAPLFDDDHALHAAQAALAMQKTVADLNETIFKHQEIHIRLGIGINTGMVVVGNLGSEQRHAYTVMGSAVNTASAIQQLTRNYPYDILAGEETAHQLPESMRLDLGAVATRKLLHKIKIFAVKGAVVE